MRASRRQRGAPTAPAASSPSPTAATATPANPAFLALSALVVLLAIVSVGWSLHRGIARSDRAPAPAPIGAAADTINVGITGFGDPIAMSVRSLSTAAAPVAAIDRFGKSEPLEVPEARAFLIGAENPTGELIGLALITPDDPGRDLRNPASADGAWVIDPVTTARALVALAPGVLDRDPALTRSRVADVADSPEFDTLVAEIIRSGDLRIANERLERALAAVLDKMPGTGVLADPRCDSAQNSVSATAVGTCLFVQQDSTVIEVSNGQPRWVAVFSDQDSAACALVPPRPAAITFDASDGCGTVVDLAAPGALAAGSGPALDRQVELVTALDAFTTYALPFADIALGGSGAASAASLATISDQPQFVTESFGSLLDTNEVARESADTLADISQPAQQRSAALLTLSRFALADSAITEQLIARSGSYEPNDVGASLLAMYDRAKVHRTGGAAPLVWSADAWQRVDLQPLLDRAVS